MLVPSFQLLGIPEENEKDLHSPLALTATSFSDSLQ